MRFKTNIDKTGWERGEWDNEPDEAEFVVAGLQCAIHRHPTLGHYCGYVECGDLEHDAIDCHGGITGGIRVNGIALSGFDCAHAGDLSPCMLKHTWTLGAFGEYRNFKYVFNEVINMVIQIRRMGGNDASGIQEAAGQIIKDQETAG